MPPEFTLASRRDTVRQAPDDDLLLQVESRRTLLSKLGEATRRVSESLDVNIVLQEVADNARYLTGARYGALLTFEPSGGIQDFLTSGLTPEEIERLDTLPRGLGLLGHLNEIREPLRLTDVASHPNSVGWPQNHPPMKTFLGMPIHYYGEHVGNIYLTEKGEGQDFTIEDEEILVLFAAQAGGAIFNARKYREEKRARADLEALLNISPVGVLVFDGKTGDLVSANEETRRIVGQVNASGPSLAHLLEAMPLRRTDGSDIPMEELPTVKAMTRGETVFADEVVIHPPDGRPPITTLVNARPIRGDGGGIVSVVATIQDVTGLEEIKRQRAEFLHNLSHELRTPLSAIQGSTSTLLDTSHPPDPDETRQFLRVIIEQADQMRQLINDLVDITQIESGTLSVTPEPVELPDLLEEAGEAGDGVELDLPPTLPRVMADRRRILQVLDNLCASVSRYSSESSAVKIVAKPRDLFLEVTVNAGSAHAATLQAPRRAHEHSKAAGNGREDLALVVCKGIVEAHGGRLSVTAREEDRGGGFTFTIPIVDEVSPPAEQAPAPSACNPPGVGARILAIGDDPETRRYVRNTLSQAGFIPLTTEDPDEAVRFIEEQYPHVIILEPTLPWADGFEMLAHVRRISDAPIIFVAGHGWERQIGRAFKLGAFDYVAKPFTSTELLARIEVALRKRSTAGRTETPEQYLYGDLSIDYAEREVTVAGRPVQLTAAEYKLLTELATAAGRVLTHEQLLRRVWGALHSTDSRIVRTYVKQLRHKLGDNAASPKYIFTKVGMGYIMPKPSTV